MKKEETDRRNYQSLGELNQSLFTYTNGFYNSVRPHSHNNDLTPNQKEAMFMSVWFFSFLLSTLLTLIQRSFQKVSKNLQKIEKNRCFSKVRLQADLKVKQKLKPASLLSLNLFYLLASSVNLFHLPKGLKNLKTVCPKGRVGSNPTFSAKERVHQPSAGVLFLYGKKGWWEQGGTPQCAKRLPMAAFLWFPQTISMIIFLLIYAHSCWILLFLFTCRNSRAKQVCNHTAGYRELPATAGKTLRPGTWFCGKGHRGCLRLNRRILFRAYRNHMPEWESGCHAQDGQLKTGRELQEDSYSLRWQRVHRQNTLLCTAVHHRAHRSYIHTPAACSCTQPLPHKCPHQGK